MKWTKQVEREGDFLKNCLLYESLVERFPVVFGINFSDFMTIRNSDVFVHYKPYREKVSAYIKKRLKDDPKFLEQALRKGKLHFSNLIEFCGHVNDKDLVVLGNDHLLRLTKEYFHLYKMPYPYFNLTIFLEDLNDDRQIDLMTRLRYLGRDSFNKAHNLISPLFDEISRRSKIPVKQLKVLTPPEIIRLLRLNKIGLEEKTADRINCFFSHFDGMFRLFEKVSVTVDEHDNLIVPEIKGKGTFPAVYKGRVRRVDSQKDMALVKKGEIIVTRMTTPQLITKQIENAGAIITDEGGITCHAAIISREFNIPALIGTRNATKILRDGDLVKVDTIKGIANMISKK